MKKSKKYSEDCSILLGKFVKPIKGKSNKNKSSRKNENVLSPIGIVFQALKNIYSIESSDEDFQRFQTEILRELSKLSSMGTYDDIFTSNFNSFFELFVSSLNVMDGMLQKLSENGIEFDPKKYLDELYGRGNN